MEMSLSPDIRRISTADVSCPRGRILKGQYVGPVRSTKGKMKGLRLWTGSQEYPIKLPKYLRPILVRELTPEMFIQVWVYADEKGLQAINVMPLPGAEMNALLADWSSPPQSDREPSLPEVCIQVCNKGKCRKRGGQNLYQLLRAEVTSNPKLQHVAIEAVGCLKACKKGPNLRLSNSKTVINHITPELALKVLADCES